MIDALTKLAATILNISNKYLLPLVEAHPSVAYLIVFVVAIRTLCCVMLLCCFRRQRRGWPKWPRVLKSKFSPTILIQIPRILTPHRLAIALVPLRLIKLLGTLAICLLIVSFYPDERWLRLFTHQRIPLLVFGSIILLADKFCLHAIARFLISGRVDVLVKKHLIIIFKYLFGMPIPHVYHWDRTIHNLRAHTNPHDRATDHENYLFKDAHVLSLEIGAANVELATVIGRQQAHQIAHLFSAPIRDLIQKNQAGVDRETIAATALDYGTQTPKAE